MMFEKLQEHYFWLHRHAELSFCEHRTQAYILEALEGAGVECQKLAGTGVLAMVGAPGAPAIALRCDIDALPIAEVTDLSYKSENQGVMHACGHDMHTAILLGTMTSLAKNPPSDRLILGIFQPAEELVPGGALKVLESGALTGFDLRAVVGQHISPELPVGTIGIHHGPFMASCDEIRITVLGHGGHAAQPANIKDPVHGAVQLLGELYALRDSQPSGSIILSFGDLQAHGATNVVPNEVKIEGTLRTFDATQRAEIKAKILEISGAVATRLGLQITIDSPDGYPPTINNPQLTTKVAKTLITSDFTCEIKEVERRLTAEDFGRYGQHYPATFLRLGCGNPSHTGLHNPAFYPELGTLKVGHQTLISIATGLPID